MPQTATLNHRAGGLPLIQNGKVVENIFFQGPVVRLQTGIFHATPRRCVCNADNANGFKPAASNLLNLDEARVEAMASDELLVSARISASVSV